MVERVCLCAVHTTEDQRTFMASLEELERLVETAHGEVVDIVVQNRQRVDQQSLIGSGKLKEVQAIIEDKHIDTLIVNQSLTPRQAQYLEEMLEIKVIDRTQLILDIFALHAQSKPGQLQVELAQIDDLLPRLSGSTKGLSRLGGGIGTRGPGETKLEIDRRRLRETRARIKKELNNVQEHQRRTRQKRQQGKQLNIGLIGYTNTGKSTLLQALTHTDTLVQDALFATLDPLTKRWDLDNGMQVTLTDTVGFIQDLPTTLIDAFQSTLEESQHMDILFHVVDASHVQRDLHEKTVLTLLDTLDMGHIPRLTIYNKIDKAEHFEPTLFPYITVSALTDDVAKVVEQGLCQLLREVWQPYKAYIPAQEGYHIAKMRQQLCIETEQYDDERQAYEVIGHAKPSSQWLRHYPNVYKNNH